jgi:ANTAR domain
MPAAATVAAPTLAAPMAGSRQGRVWGLIAEQAARNGGHASAANACTAAVATLQITGAWLSAESGTELTGHLMWVTDALSERLAELQLTLGEGPCPDAAADGGPVLASDLGEMEAGRRWPAFAQEARRAGAAAIFAFPLRIGAIRAGVMGMYRDQAGPLSAEQLGDALIFADAATLLLISADQAGENGPGSGPGGQPADLAGHRAEIDQATGMLTEQLGVGVAEAFVRLRAYAYVHDRPLADLARDIVARRLRLGPDPGLSEGGRAAPDRVLLPCRYRIHPADRAAFPQRGAGDGRTTAVGHVRRADRHHGGRL